MTHFGFVEIANARDSSDFAFVVDKKILKPQTLSSLQECFLGRVRFVATEAGIISNQMISIY